MSQMKMFISGLFSVRIGREGKSGGGGGEASGSNDVFALSDDVSVLVVGVDLSDETFEEEKTTQRTKETTNHFLHGPLRREISPGQVNVEVLDVGENVAQPARLGRGEETDAVQKGHEDEIVVQRAEKSAGEADARRVVEVEQSVRDEPAGRGRVELVQDDEGVEDHHPFRRRVEEIPAIVREETTEGEILPVDLLDVAEDRRQQRNERTGSGATLDRQRLLTERILLHAGQRLTEIGTVHQIPDRMPLLRRQPVDRRAHRLQLQPTNGKKKMMVRKGREEKGRVYLSDLSRDFRLSARPDGFLLHSTVKTLLQSTGRTEMTRRLDDRTISIPRASKCFLNRTNERTEDVP